MHAHIIIKLVLLLVITNGAPVIARLLLRQRYSQPLDRKLDFVDGRPLLGPAKTVRGIVSAMLVTALMASALLLSLAGCLGSEEPESHWIGTAPAAEETAPLAGAALEQRREQMVPAQRDLAHVETTL